MSRRKNEAPYFSRRSLLKSMGLAPFVLRAAPLRSLAFTSPGLSLDPETLSFSEFRLRPHYPAPSPLEAVLALVPPGSDEYAVEKYAFQIGQLFDQWSQALQAGTTTPEVLVASLDSSIEGTSLAVAQTVSLRTGNGVACDKRVFAEKKVAGREAFLHELRLWLGNLSRVLTAEFQITHIEQTALKPLRVRAEVRYNLVGKQTGAKTEERVGVFLTEWVSPQADKWVALKWTAAAETVATVEGQAFVDVSEQLLGGAHSYKQQLLRGVDHWRTVLDGACGIDVYGNNGVAVGDFDQDGHDDIYVCQPSGLPNRLYRNRGDGSLEDVTEKAGVGVLDGTACALFADFENKGRQDLLVVCGSGPLLFQNKGDGTFDLKRDAFRFAQPPQGTFTHAALADYDGDGRLDIYFCLYSYYLGLDQYHYPIPYFDARNGPPNYLLHNEGDGTFVDRTQATGLHAENDRYSFACAWGHSTASGLPDLYVANDFGRANLYRNRGNGTFQAVSTEAQVNEPGAGMSACWSDVDNDGKQDIYEANMWSAAGLRVSAQKNFQEQAPEPIRKIYRRHARGNSLYRNQGNGVFSDVTARAGVEMGRWSWCSDFWDFDHDGYPDLYIANGYISAPQKDDLGSFFWRQVVGKSPQDATPSPAYEHGWNALNELIRSDRSWSGYERNVLYVNNRDGSFTEASGALSMDFPEDSRSFALADLDHDGRLEVILKNRNAPQLRILHNVLPGIGSSIAIRLRGRQSNRDGIGTEVVVQAGAIKQSKYLSAGSGFLAQHSKELFFGVGDAVGTVNSSVRWPSGVQQNFSGLPVNHRVTIEEGSAEFVAEPFAASPKVYERAGPSAEPETPSSQIETWLIEPLKAPVLSLADLAGNMQEIRSRKGGCVLLNFWATASPSSTDQLRLFRRKQAAATESQLEIIAVNLDDEANVNSARSFAAQERFPFPVLFATVEAAGVYNIIYRYLFDRRRDLAIPASFLLNRGGMIAKVYQGPIDFEHLLEDVKSVPGTADDRMRKALPFAGTIYHDAFQRNDFTYGVALFQHGYLEGAAASFEQVIAQKPDDPEAYYNLGTLHLRRGNLEQARYYMEQAVKLRANYPEAWNNLGMIAAQQGQPDQAERNFEQSLAQRPNYAIALLNLGNFYRRQGAFDRAEALLKRALEIQPEDPETNYSVGMLAAQQGQVQSAADYLKRAIALRPGYPEALNNLGVLYTRGKNYSEAEAQFKACIQANPNFDQSYMNLARLYVMQNDKEKAREAILELLQLQPQNQGAQQALEMLKSLP
jgi:Flp pilus assembly protein TadD/peroxiredoxin